MRFHTEPCPNCADGYTQFPTICERCDGTHRIVIRDDRGIILSRDAVSEILYTSESWPSRNDIYGAIGLLLVVGAFIVLAVGLSK